MKKSVALLGLLWLTILDTFAQNSGVEMATALRSSGKIYVVVFIICLIFIGLAAYLFSIDKKITRLEKKQK